MGESQPGRPGINLKWHFAYPEDAHEKEIRDAGPLCVWTIDKNAAKYPQYFLRRAYRIFDRGRYLSTISVWITQESDFSWLIQHWNKVSRRNLARFSYEDASDYSTEPRREFSVTIETPT